MFIDIRILCKLPGVFLIFALILSVKADSKVEKERPENSSVWTWQCTDNKCQKYPVVENTTTSEGTFKETVRNVMSLEVCKLTCGHPPGSLWPLPTGTVNISGPVIPVNGKTVKYKITMENEKEPDSKLVKLFEKVSEYFNERLASKTLDGFNENDSDLKSLIITAVVKSPYESFDLSTVESYTLRLNQESSKTLNALVTSDSFFGMRHALETLNQLIVYDVYNKHLVVPENIFITDKPSYSYRGLTLDTARNFISVGSIKRTLDGMAANKLNVFHWHITDTHSFPFVSTSLPEFSLYGAYSPEKVYKPSDIKEIVEYAKIRGIKVIPEFDAPAHVGEGWQWTPPETVVCLNEQPWNLYCVEPPCGQLNPTKDYLYDHILPNLYKDLVDAFEVDNLFHMGGDEVHFRCWNNNTQITNWMTSKGWSIDEEGFFKLWDYFQDRAYNIVKPLLHTKDSPNAILWTSGLTTGKPLDKYVDKKKYIIQVWTTGYDPNINELLEKGYKVILSNYDALYLDCGFGGWVSDGNNWCSPYKTWQNIYANNPGQFVGNFTDAKRRLILGQSAALWTEQADDQTIDNRFWPRAAALAERTWTDPETNWTLAEYRMLHQRERLVKLGLAVESLQPLWCNQNEGSCPA